MEVVAKKYPRKTSFIVILLACFLMFAVGLALLIAYIFINDMEDIYSYIGMALMILGFILTALMVFTLIRFCRLPENLITYENGVLTFPKGITLRPEEISSVDFTKANPAYQNVSYDFGFGLIKVEAGSKKIKAYYVANPEGAANRLREIINEARYSK